MTAFADIFKDLDMIRTVMLTQGTHPDDIITILRYAPLGLESMLWRNTVLEEWHADPESRISDADMFRANTQTTDIMQRHLWSAFGEQLMNVMLMSAESFTGEDIPLLAEALDGLVEEAFASARILPNGKTLADLGQDDLEDFQNYALHQVYALMEQAQEHGVYVVLAFLALRGRLGSRWSWSSPEWPLLVDNFMSIATDPGHAWWDREHNHYPKTLPADVADFGLLRNTLLVAPWEMSLEAAEFCTDVVGIGFTAPTSN